MAITSGHSLPTPAQLCATIQKADLDRVKAVDPRITPLRKYGSNALAYSTLQPGLEYFFSDDGYIAFSRFGTMRRSVHVLGDPIAGDKESILRKFIQIHPAALFYQISKETAEILTSLCGYYINMCGLERVIDVEKFCLDGKQMSDMRRFRNVCQKAGVQVFESVPQDHLNAIRDISREWLSTKPVANKELNFLARPMVFEPELDVRYLFAGLNKEIIAYIVYDPVYRDDTIIGYQPVIQRAKNNVPKGTLDAINMHFIGFLKKERKHVYLGFSPFAGIEPGPFKESPFTRRLFMMFYEKGNTFYGFKNLEFHKERYRAKKIPVYFASKSKIPIKQLIDGYRLCGVLSARTIAPFLWSLFR